MYLNRFPVRRVASAALLAAAVAGPAMLAGGCAGNDLRRAEAQQNYYRQIAMEQEAAATASAAEAALVAERLANAKREADANAAALFVAEGRADAAEQRATEASTKAEEMELAYVKATESGNAPLPPELVAELEDFVASNPGLLTFDAEHGLVRFESDVTFAAGSADLKQQAEAAASKLAALLNSPAAMSMDVMVAGHTDSKPVTRESTRRRGHKDNWYLSSHRAIAVSRALNKAGVSETRMAVMGHADQRPVATNATESGRSQNRRVEVVVVPTISRFAGETYVDVGNDDWADDLDGAFFTPGDTTANLHTGPMYSK